MVEDIPLRDEGKQREVKTGAADVVLTLVVAVSCWVAFHAIFAFAYVLNKSGLNTYTLLYPNVNLALGVFIGYRLGRYGWAYATLPVIAVTLVMCAWNINELTYLWLPCKLPVGLLSASLGGFIGERLVRPH